MNGKGLLSRAEKVVHTEVLFVMSQRLLRLLLLLLFRFRGRGLAFGAPPAGVAEDGLLIEAGSRVSFMPCRNQHLSPRTQYPALNCGQNFREP